ncbi:hypothetical protein BDZ89DRAFT_786762 [Hymenopellis radicata]|nr:hypothetical protein BDZ89DRAFT_786762 [Hymenopellis radicata]
MPERKDDIETTYDPPFPPWPRSGSHLFVLSTPRLDRTPFPKGSIGAGPSPIWELLLCEHASVVGAHHLLLVVLGLFVLHLSFGALFFVGTSRPLCCVEGAFLFVGRLPCALWVGVRTRGFVEI